MMAKNSELEITCVACGGSHVRQRACIISPFMSEYALQRPVDLSSVFECLDCAMLFYALRPTGKEMARLYGGYRSEPYFQIRNKHEPWYSRTRHDALGEESSMPMRRKAFLDNVSRYQDLGSFTSVLDYGGDRGQMLADGPGEKRYVYDMSAAQTEPYVEKIANEADLKAGAYDLILLLHVLEHVSAPAQMLEEMKHLLVPGGVLFIEVPREHFDIRKIPSRPWYKKYLQFLLRHRLLFLPLYCYSTFMRIRFSLIPPLGFAAVNEHINLFSPEGLRACLKRSGYSVEDVFYCKQMGNLCAVAVVKKS